MSKSQQQLAALAGLVVIMLAVYIKAFRPAPPTPAAGPKTAGTASDTLPTVTASRLPMLEGPREAQRQRLAALKWERDPFTRGSAAGSLNGLSLNGILFDATRPMAIINGTMVEVGQELEGYQVVAITSDSVLLNDGTEQVQLQVSP